VLAETRLPHAVTVCGVKQANPSVRSETARRPDGKDENKLIADSQ
jgi:hypothetical protein